jgi:2-phosphosulfolactate phosphatase
MRVFVYHTPELIPAGELPDCAIAIDVLRATSTIATALANGAEAVEVYADLESLAAASAPYPPGKILRGGERGGKQVEGFDFGNSPLSCTPEKVAGRRVFMSTTNGTRTLQRIQRAAVVLTAAFVNLGHVARFVLANRYETIWLVGSGWQGNFSLEDTACAGALVERLGGADNDEAVASAALFETWRDDLAELLEKASHGKRLLNLGCQQDLLYCAQIDSVAALPRQSEPGILVQGLP